MTTFCIQIQPHRAIGIDLAKVKELGESIAGDSDLVSRFGVVEGMDGVPYMNFMFETAEAPSLWQRLQAELYGSEVVGEALRSASIATCEGKDGWSDYLLLYHFNEREKLDGFQ